MSIARFKHSRFNYTWAVALQVKNGLKKTIALKQVQCDGKKESSNEALIKVPRYGILDTPSGHVHYQLCHKFCRCQ